MDHVQIIWKPVHFDDNWKKVNTEEFDNLRPSWDKRRVELSKNEEQYKEFIEKLKRKQAIDTGIIENMYDLDRGITETFVKEGFVYSHIQHNDTNIDKDVLMTLLQDNIEAMDFIFDFIKSDRELSAGYIHQLHCLVTRHQDTVDSIDSLGRPGKSPLLRGEYKKLPNNPKRSDGTICEYCPPVHVASEMDCLLKIFNTENNDTHILILTAFFHHAFTQIHPYQDGNGRVARLLASFVLIKDNLFPFSLDREKKNVYIDALEDADKGNYQNLVNIIANTQIESIKEALKLETVGKDGSYDKVLEELKNRIANKKATDQQNIINKMQAAFELIKKQTVNYKESLTSVLGESVVIDIESCDPSGEKEYFYTHQIAQYAKNHKYYFNSSLPRRWTRIRIAFDDTHKYQLILSLHHYGYDNSTFAIGAFIEKQLHGEAPEQDNKQILFTLENQPYVFFSGKDISTIEGSICEKIESIFTETLAYIAEEFS